MRTVNFQISSCCRCAFYMPEGRRGGQCGRFGVSVQGNWKSCPLAIPPFLTPIEKVEVMDTSWPPELGVTTEEAPALTHL